LVKALLVVAIIITICNRKVIIWCLLNLNLGPAMKLLHEVVIPRIAAKWSLVADYLEYEVEDKNWIREKCRDDPLKCCVELLENWLSSDKGVSPKSWSKLIQVLSEIKSLTSTTEKIVEDLANAGVFV